MFWFSFFLLNYPLVFFHHYSRLTIFFFFLKNHQRLCIRDLSHEEAKSNPSSWKALYQTATHHWRNWKQGAFKLQYVKTGGSSFFCLLEDRIIFKTPSCIQCSNLQTSAVLWRVDVSLDPKLRNLQVDPVSERILFVTKSDNVYIYDSTGTLHHTLHADGHIVQSVINNNLLFLLLKFKATKQCRLDVWDVQHRLVLRSFAPAYRSRFCVGPETLLLGERNAIRVWSVPNLQPALSVPTERVRSHKFMATSGVHVVRVLKLAAEAYEIQVIDAQQQTLEWRLSSTHPIRALLVDAWRLVVAFKDYVRVWDLRSRALLLHLPKEIMSEQPERIIPPIKLVEAKASWFSVFSATCVAFQQQRLLVKFPVLPHIVLFDFSGSHKTTAASSTPTTNSPTTPLVNASLQATARVIEEDAGEEPSDVTAMTLYGDRLHTRASELATDTINLDEFL